jgi:hypothetical protein
MIRMSSLARSALVAVSLAGCQANTLGPVPGASAAVVQEDWKPIWADMQACTGITGDLARLHVYRSPNGTLPDGGLGAWSAPHNIYLADYVFETDFATVVLHEMVHDLIGVSDPHHLNPLWKKCDPNYAFIEEKNG